MPSPGVREPWSTAFGLPRVVHSWCRATVKQPLDEIRAFVSRHKGVIMFVLLLVLGVEIPGDGRGITA
jgi:hypothetical protein